MTGLNRRGIALPGCREQMFMARNAHILGPFTVSRTWQALGWVATAVMALVTLGYLASAI